MRRSLALLALWLTFASSAAGAAETQPAPVVAPIIIVIDFQAVVRDSAAAIAIRQQIDAVRATFQEEFDAIEDELRAVEAELTDLRSTLADNEFVQRRRSFERRVTETQRQAQARRAALDQALDQAMSQVRSELLEVVADIAKERQANLVLSQSQVVLSDRALNVTDAAKARLDERLPTVTVVLPPDPQP